MSDFLKLLEEGRTQAANCPRAEKEQFGQFLTPLEVAAYARPQRQAAPSTLRKADDHPDRKVGANELYTGFYWLASLRRLRYWR